MKFSRFLIPFCLLGACALTQTDGGRAGGPFFVVLGIAQDGGYPQAGCRKDCCARAWQDRSAGRQVASAAIVDPESGRRWMIDATPDFRQQLRMLDQLAAPGAGPGLSGIFVTHAHIGHYTGLMQLGREVMGSKKTAVFAMPLMGAFLQANGPWAQLVRLENITLKPLQDGVAVKLNERLTVTPFLVPHRDEYSETVGYLIEGPAGSVAYIPDTDKWERWPLAIETIVSRVDAAFLDGTFYQEGEIPGRNMASIPHPFIEESMKRFAALPQDIRGRIRFIHLNHTNPALAPDSEDRRIVNGAGFRIAEEMEKVAL